MDKVIPASTPETTVPQFIVQSTVSKAPEDSRVQPWKQHLAEIEKEAEEYRKTNNPDGDLFKVHEGFNDHGMSG